MHVAPVRAIAMLQLHICCIDNQLESGRLRLHGCFCDLNNNLIIACRCYINCVPSIRRIISAEDSPPAFHSSVFPFYLFIYLFSASLVVLLLRFIHSFLLLCHCSVWRCLGRDILPGGKKRPFRRVVLFTSPNENARRSSISSDCPGESLQSTKKYGS